MKTAIKVLIIMYIAGLFCIIWAYKAGVNHNKQQIEQKIYSQYGEGDQGQALVYYFETDNVGDNMPIGIDRNYIYQWEEKGNSEYELISSSKNKYMVKSITNKREYQLEVDDSGIWVYDNKKLLEYISYKSSPQLAKVIIDDNL